VPTVFSYGFKSGRDDYFFYVSKPLWSRAGNASTVDTSEEPNAAVTALTPLQWAEAFAASLEEQIRQYPHQWFNFYNYWSVLPDSVSIAPA
jgi:lauroyl/myristoyl acyltransferase